MIDAAVPTNERNPNQRVNNPPSRAYIYSDDSSLIHCVCFNSPVQRGNLEHKSDSSNETVSHRAVNMKAVSPVRSFRKSSANVTEHSLGISRSKTPVDDPLSLLYNMNDCYSKLKELVPSIPQNKNVSKMEILQHVIDYILDLQIALDSNSAITSLHHPRAGQGTSRTPLTTLNTDISILSLQVNALINR